MIYANRPLFVSPTGWLPGTLQPSTHYAGRWRIILPDGTVLSVQPDVQAEYQSRPAGTDGPYEAAQRVGDKLVYTPAPGWIWVIPILDGVTA